MKNEINAIARFISKENDIELIDKLRKIEKSIITINGENMYCVMKLVLFPFDKKFRLGYKLIKKLLTH
ncbi:hypothetical protein [Methanobrevibacter filiformis]|uniref:hypothetical protein n=1 Tax=Methanobrevibacter filiformis TaxID=55758 RepID=UPI001FE1C448|nr:hypothetical protein [Methanobrevibacter filiformis]